jgi:hypothetical protein
MAWLWLIIPAVLLGAAAVLWRVTARLERHRDVLEAQRTALQATGREQARR